MTNKMAVFLLLVLGAALLPAPAVAQLGSRPAEEWALVLESGRRLEALEIENVVNALNLEPGDVVADVGAGTGIFSVPIGRAVGPAGTVLAVEVDRGFLPMIDEKAHGSDVHNVQTVLGEYGDPKLPRENVDVAFMHDVLHHIQDRADYLIALAGYLGSEGRIAIVDYDARHPATPHQDDPTMLITPAQVDGWMADAGFELAETVEMFEEKFYRIYSRRR